MTQYIVYFRVSTDVPQPPGREPGYQTFAFHIEADTRLYSLTEKEAVERALMPLADSYSFHRHWAVKDGYWMSDPEEFGVITPTQNKRLDVIVEYEDVLPAS